MTPDELDTAATIIAMERTAMDRWGRGDPDGFLEISAAEVSYFDPFTAARLDGLDALRLLYDQFRGKIQIDHYELVEPRVQLAGDTAILTYLFDSKGSEGSMRWNTTEVYQKTAAGWKIVHTHWAYCQPKLAP